MPKNRFRRDRGSEKRLNTPLEPPKPPSISKRLGFVTDVRINSVVIHAEPDAIEQSGLFAGAFFAIEIDSGTIIGTISSVQSAIEGSTARGDLVATIQKGSGRVEPGVSRPPLVGSPVLAADVNLAKKVTQSREVLSTNVAINLATLPHDESVSLSFIPEHLFGRHLAVVGASGSGKSWTLGRIVSECAKFRSKVILFDATGEFRPLRQGARHVYIGDDPYAPPYAVPVSIPYSDLNESDLFAIFQPVGQSQAAKLRAAIESLRLARLEPGLAPNGMILKAHRSKKDFFAARSDYAQELEDPRALFDIRVLCAQIQNECVDAQQSPSEPMYWGGQNAVDYSHCVALINRIQDVIRLPSLNPIFSPRDEPALFDEILNFLQAEDESVLRINLQYLSFAHHAREIVANAIGRYLMEAARLDVFRKKPLLAIVDEAHQFLNNTLIPDSKDNRLDSFALLAKEGRKYGLTMCLVTQRPRDIPEDILSQMGTMIIHRLVNHHDLSIVERAAGGLHGMVASGVPCLRTGEAILLGVDFPMPTRIRIQAPWESPESQGPDFQKYWI